MFDHIIERFFGAKKVTGNSPLSSFASMPDLQVVESSNLYKVGYDEDTEELIVTFRSGNTYKYDGVPLHTYVELMDAPSLGSYFYYNIRTSYPFQKLEPITIHALKLPFKRREEEQKKKEAEMAKQWAAQKAKQPVVKPAPTPQKPKTAPAPLGIAFHKGDIVQLLSSTDEHTSNVWVGVELEITENAPSLAKGSGYLTAKVLKFAHDIPGYSVGASVNFSYGPTSVNTFKLLKPSTEVPQNLPYQIGDEVELVSTTDPIYDKFIGMRMTVAGTTVAYLSGNITSLPATLSPVTTFKIGQHMTMDNTTCTFKKVVDHGTLQPVDAKTIKVGDTIVLSKTTANTLVSKDWEGLVAKVTSITATEFNLEIVTTPPALTDMDSYKPGTTVDIDIKPCVWLKLIQGTPAFKPGDIVKLVASSNPLYQKDYLGIQMQVTSIPSSALISGTITKWPPKAKAAKKYYHALGAEIAFTEHECTFTLVTPAAAVPDSPWDTVKKGDHVKIIAENSGQGTPYEDAGAAHGHTGVVIVVKKLSSGTAIQIKHDMPTEDGVENTTLTQAYKDVFEIIDAPKSTSKKPKANPAEQDYAANWENVQKGDHVKIIAENYMTGKPFAGKGAAHGNTGVVFEVVELPDEPTALKKVWITLDIPSDDTTPVLSLTQGYKDAFEIIDAPEDTPVVDPDEGNATSPEVAATFKVGDTLKIVGSKYPSYIGFVVKLLSNTHGQLNLLVISCPVTFKASYGPGKTLSVNIDNNKFERISGPETEPDTPVKEDTEQVFYLEYYDTDDAGQVTKKSMSANTFSGYNPNSLCRLLHKRLSEMPAQNGLTVVSSGSDLINVVDAEGNPKIHLICPHGFTEEQRQELMNTFG